MRLSIDALLVVCTFVASTLSAPVPNGPADASSDHYARSADFLAFSSGGVTARNNANTAETLSRVGSMLRAVQESQSKVATMLRSVQEGQSKVGTLRAVEEGESRVGSVLISSGGGRSKVGTLL